MRLLRSAFPFGVLLALLLAAAPVAAQFTVPAVGSPERTAILDALRPVVAGYANVRTPFVFAVDAIRVSGAHAFVLATPQQNGRTLPSLVARCPEADQVVAALFRRSGGRWSVVDWGTCATDVFYMGWPGLYDVSPALLGFEISEADMSWAARVVAPSGSDPWLALRSEPSVSRGSRLARMPHDAEVTVLACLPDQETVGGRQGSWCRVRYGNQTGWAFDAYLRAP
ncbi:MAG TPA: SH3 domain-containing protein [Rhodothermales bacterium]|nr:SH3 domain-containing protein [Rhodothermales bacterium]